METKANRNQIVITVNSEGKKERIPLNLIITLAAGTLTGVGIIFLLFMGAKLLFGL